MACAGNVIANALCHSYVVNNGFTWVRPGALIFVENSAGLYARNNTAQNDAGCLYGDYSDVLHVGVNVTGKLPIAMTGVPNDQSITAHVAEAMAAEYHFLPMQQYGGLSFQVVVQYVRGLVSFMYQGRAI